MSELVIVPGTGEIIEVLGVREQAHPLHSRWASALHGFLSNCLSPTTRSTYAQALSEFFAAVSPYIRELTDLRREHIIGFRNQLTESGLSENTVLKKLCAVSSMCKYLAEEGLIDKDVTYGIKRPKAYLKKETAALTEKEVKRVFASLVPGQRAYYSHRALLAVGFYTGLRSSEIRSLKVSDFTHAEGKPILKSKLKGGLPHEVPLTAFVLRCLNDHLQRLREFGFKLRPEDYLFPRLGGARRSESQPIGSAALRKILLSKLKAADISLSPERRYSPHCMRATLATHLLIEVEAPIHDVQELLGHGSPATTIAYIKRKKRHDKSPVFKIEY